MVSSQQPGGDQKPRVKMQFCSKLLLTAAFLFAVEAPSTQALASDNPAMDASVARVEHEWERIKYQTSDPHAQHTQIQILARDAAAVTARYPGRAEPLIWQGIAESEQAAMSGGLNALADAKASRRTFEMAYQLDRTALEAGAATSLGTLYYRVPGFPIGFGDKAKARHYLVEAVTIAPASMDANYFFGDFLFSQGEYAAAGKVLQHALASPPHPDRPIWDVGRRAEIRALLAKVNAKLRSS
jgi:tetratricopeptide (TPR) repeat protein